MKINKSLGVLLFVEGTVLGDLLQLLLPTRVAWVFISWTIAFWMYYWYNEKRSEERDLIADVERKLRGDVDDRREK